MGERAGRGRRALVLGAGGYLGAAWSLGALTAVRETAGWDIDDIDLIVGTSAGAALAMLLRSGVEVDELAGAAETPVTAGATVGTGVGTAIPDNSLAVLDVELESSWTGPARLGVGSLPLLWHAVRNPGEVRPTAWCAALVPPGRQPLTAVGKLITERRGPHPWPRGTHVVATDFHTGSRTVFGRPDAPVVSPGTAVMASCAVPGWFRPVEIDAVPYVDGAVYSACNADLAVGCDEVYVLAPMASLRPDRPTSALGRLERWWRRQVTERTLTETRLVADTGARVHLLTPEAEELEVMGTNMMDAARRAAVFEAARDGALRRLRRPRPARTALLPAA